MNCELESLLVLVDQSFDFEEIVLLKGVENLVDVVPHLGFQLPASVAQRQRQVGLARFLGLDLLRHDDESGGDDLILVANAIADVKVLHGCLSIKQRQWERGFYDSAGQCGRTAISGAMLVGFLSVPGESGVLRGKSFTAEFAEKSRRVRKGKQAMTALGQAYSTAPRNMRSRNHRMPNFLCFFLLSFLASASFAETVSTGLV